MRVLLVSKACIVGQYQSKLEALARQEDIELTVVVPPFWKDERGQVAFERCFTRGYALRIEPMTLNGHFHLHFYPTLPSIMQSVQPDIVHIDEEPYNLATFHALRAANAVGAASLFFTWQNMLRRYPPPFSWFEGYAYRHCAYAIAGNRAAADVLRAKKYAGPIRVIPQFGVDLKRYAPQPEAERQDGPFCIGFVGRLVEEKGPQVLMRAAAGLQGEWRLLFVGSGPMETRLKSLAHELHIYERVQFEPWTASRNMPSVYHRMDVLVLPSLAQPNWKEQFGRVLIEAMASMVPVIGSECGEIPLLIGDAGLTFRENDVQGLSAQLETLRRDTGLRAQLGIRGRNRVRLHYTQQRIADETYQVYLEIARGANSQARGIPDSRS